MSQDTERREWERLRRLGWEPTTPPPQVCDGPVTPQTPAPIRSQDTERPSGRLPERLTDEQVDRITRYNDCNVDGGLAAILAREVQAGRNLAADLRRVHYQKEGKDCCNECQIGAYPCLTVKLIDEAGL